MRDHSVAFFIEPILAAHDRAAFDVFCYSTAVRGDAVTQRLASKADHWRDCGRLSDYAIAQQIRNDGIDLLVDLAGHTVGNRLAVFAMRATPVQASWIGYPNTTGLKTMDFRLTDAISDPPGADAFSTERLVRLPHGFLCFQPSNDAPPPQAPSDGRPFTLASFNAVPKYSDGCIAAWAQILRRLPTARLRLKAADLANGLARRRLLAAFAAHGIEAQRIALLPLVASRREHLAAYHDIDLALDPFPYNGTTTTCEALWMGVPVLTLRGQIHAGRTGASLLTQVGLEAFIAETKEAYVEAAVAFAGKIGRDANRRADLRARMKAAPLCRPDIFVPTLERAYRDMAAARRAELSAH
jgi:predicted O-linked N-acetylglucosamine transferase (SPINDLY family)